MADDISPSGADSSPPSAKLPASRQTGESAISSKLLRRYSDAYTEAHMTVAIGKLIKLVGMCLLILFLFIGVLGLLGMLINSGSQGASGSGMSAFAAVVGIAIACLVGVPTFIFGILVASQGQTQLAALDTAVNSSRHLNDDEVAQVLTNHFMTFESLRPRHRSSVRVVKIVNGRCES